MNAHPTTVDGEMELDRAVNVMRNAGLRRLPVTRAGARVVGVLSLDDVAIDLQHYLDAFLAVAGQHSRKGL
jgi:predicted transcriptional regulator